MAVNYCRCSRSREVPFLAGTLLYLNNHVPWRTGVSHNGWITNALLIVIPTVFLFIGVNEILKAI